MALKIIIFYKTLSNRPMCQAVFFKARNWKILDRVTSDNIQYDHQLDSHRLGLLGTARYENFHFLLLSSLSRCCTIMLPHHPVIPATRNCWFPAAFAPQVLILPRSSSSSSSLSQFAEVRIYKSHQHYGLRYARIKLTGLRKTPWFSLRWVMLENH